MNDLPETVLCNVAEVPCSACGKDMKDPVSGMTIIGAVLTYEVPEPNPGKIIFRSPTEKFLREQFGKFAPPEGERKIVYQFCYECWLKSLFGAYR